MPRSVSDPADPRRCKGSNAAGQCRNAAMDDHDYCEHHSPGVAADTAEKRGYHLAQAQHRSRLAYFADHEHVKSLRDEIGILRILIESRFNLITNDADLLAACGPLNNLILSVERLVKSAHSLEQNLGTLLGKPALLRLGQTLCEIIIGELQGVPGFEEKIDHIIERLIKTVADAQNPTE